MMAIKYCGRGSLAFQLVLASSHTMSFLCVCICATMWCSLARCMSGCDAVTTLKLGTCMCVWVNMMAIKCCHRGSLAVQLALASFHTMPFMCACICATMWCSLARCLSGCYDVTTLKLGMCICAWVYMMAIKCCHRGALAFQLVLASSHTMPFLCVCICSRQHTLAIAISGKMSSKSCSFWAWSRTWWYTSQ